MSAGLYLLAFRHAKAILCHGGGIRLALAAMKREVTRRKLADAITRDGLFPASHVRVPHLDIGKGIVTARIDSVHDKSGASLLLTSGGYALNGNPVACGSAYYSSMRGVERIVLAQHPDFGKPPRSPDLPMSRVQLPFDR